jgi:hypothetical protein
MILQLPFVAYLNDNGRNSMQPYDHFKPYLVSHGLRWSYPAMSNQQFRWQRLAATLPTAQLVPAMRGQGFDGVLLDRHGYADAGNALKAELVASGAAVVLETNRYLAFDVRSVVPNDARFREMLAQPDGPRTSTLAACSALRAVNAMDYIGERIGPFPSPLDVPAGRALELSGWAVLPEGHRAAQTLELVLDGQPVVVATYGFERPDVAAYFQLPDALNSGYRVTLPGELLTAGAHKLSIREMAADSGCYFESEPVALNAR